MSPHRDGGGVGVGGGCNELDESVHLKDMQSDNIIRGTHDRLQKKKLIFEEIENKSQMQKEIDVFEAGQRKKDYQNQLLSVMFGGS